MDIEEKRKEVTALINNIKEHSDRLKELETLPLLELSVILSKINKLHENTLILKYLSAVEQHHEEEEFGIDVSFIKANLEKEIELKEQEDEGAQIDMTEEVREDAAAFENVEKEVEEENTFIDEVAESSDENSEAMDATQEDLEEESSFEKEEVIVEDKYEEAIEIAEEVAIEEEPLESIEEEHLDEEEEEAISSDNSLEAEEEEDMLPTMSLEEMEQKEELESKPDLNEVFSEGEDASLSSQLKKQPIADLLSAIGLNERYSYANELFDGDVDDFKRAVGLLNDFDSASEAIDFFNNELSRTYNWEADNEIVKALFQLVERRHLN